MTPFWRGFLTGLALGPVWRRLTTALYGEVVVTTTEAGECVWVTRQDNEGRVLSVIWEKGSPSNAAANSAGACASPGSEATES